MAKVLNCFTGRNKIVCGLLNVHPFRLSVSTLSISQKTLSYL